ncbi:MAG: hypothetical protein DRJ03_12195 [Chloroflexi bacterium]|nr:MAG: hypothetical protein DRJ03_12180 [Chloroflexota bacterium]RLC85260.1 MAG: hypothetical protein DRJ03_12195 [Chloroflexota bacterium]
MPTITRAFRNIIEALLTILKYPVLLSLFALDVIVVIPSCFFMVFPEFGFVIGFAVLIGSQAPIIYIIVKEIWRQLHMLPMSEAWETTWENWNEAIDYWVQLNKSNDET